MVSTLEAGGDAEGGAWERKGLAATDMWEMRSKAATAAEMSDPPAAAALATDVSYAGLGVMKLTELWPCFGRRGLRRPSPLNSSSRVRHEPHPPHL